MTLTLFLGLGSTLVAGMLWPLTAIYVRQENVPAAIVTGAIAALNTLFVILRIVEFIK